MAYNDKYFFEFGTLKTGDSSLLSYKVVFSQKEDIPVVYDQIELTPSNAPFVLSYKSAEDFAFSPFRVSSAEINILYPLSAGDDVPTPENFFTSIDDFSWRVQLYETTDNGATFQLKWQGFLITSDVQYEWQDAYYYRLTATDNLAVLKDVKYSRSDRFAMQLYTPNQGAELIEFISELLIPTEQQLNITVACNWKNDNVTKTFQDIVVSKYSAIDWNTGEPKDCYTVLSNLMRGIGCILYQSNIDASWTVLNINEIGTTSGNTIPTTIYDYEGTELSTGTLNLNDGINTGGEFIWRDRNQIVSIKRPIGYIELTFPYQRKNLLRNYGFQDDVDDITNDWATVGTFTTSTFELPNNIYANNSVPYDKVVTSIDEATTSFTTPSDYLKNNVDLLETDLNDIENPGALGTLYFFYIKFDYIVNDNSWTADGDGFNYQLVIDSGATINNYYFDNIFGLYQGTTAGGLFITTTTGRMAEFVSQYKKYVKCNTRTTEVIISALTSAELRFLPLVQGSGSATTGYAIDNVELNISATRWKSLTELGFFASNGGFKNNPMKIKSEFHGGTDRLDWWFFEDCIGVKVTPDVVTRPQSNNLWGRSWETITEAIDENLVQKICLNILSFYRKNSRKFTGNVYGDGMTFAKYFSIGAALDKTAIAQVEDAFEAMVLADIGEVETSYCSSDFLSEFYQPLSKFLSIEMSIDYANSTTLVNLHEDFTSTNEVGFQVGATHKYENGGVFGQITGGGINTQQSNITSG